MSEFIYKTPEGFNDILTDECKSRLEAEGQLRNVFKGFGYSEVNTPTLEYYDLFSGRIGTLPQERMFKLFDSKGRILVLRPDMTVPIMRMAVTKIEEDSLPVRLSYFGNIFRNDNKNLLSSEYRQGGIEILGADTIAADAEVIAVAIKSLIDSGVEDFRIDIGQVKLFKALTTGIEDENMLESIRQAAANKDKYTIEKLLENTSLDEAKKKKLLKLPWMFGSLEILEDMEYLIEDDGEAAALGELVELVEILKMWGYGKYISIDLGMVQSLDYYSGIVFRGYAVDCGFSICWGGRYDFLSENFNRKIPATGCAMGISRIVEVLARKGKVKRMKGADYLVTTWNEILDDTAFKIAENLRDRGFVVENNLVFNETKLKEYCRGRNIGRMIKVLDKDIVQITDFDSGSEMKCSIACLLE